MSFINLHDEYGNRFVVNTSFISTMTALTITSKSGEHHYTQVTINDRKVFVEESMDDIMGLVDLT